MNSYCVYILHYVIEAFLQKQFSARVISLFNEIDKSLTCTCGPYIFSLGFETMMIKAILIYK